uniref:Uncharacterized protein n=1 Tax=Candidatus Kentrum sp. TC TaxID=2126339 RepID=A0A451A0Q6_9GAMM|nr:MAG: hypothetical protein BECKTC1821E_GA0114239_103910 [Candidatus Kentron sp. TC]VFK59608.1 MAG: hypothetical protein BECKTC1821F_GA0114240_10359 [Candidatus Kentron sp. TC]
MISPLLANIVLNHLDWRLDSLGYRVSRRYRWLSLKRYDQTDTEISKRSNPICTGPYLYRTTCSNSPPSGVCSQRSRMTDGDGGAKQDSVREVSPNS